MSTCTTNTFTAPARPRKHRGAVQVLRDLFALRRQRRQLSDLDDHLLSDIGITRDEAIREGERRAWDAPAHWLR